MEDFDYERACVTLANKLIMDLKLPVPRIQSIYEITSTLYVHLVAAVRGDWPNGAIKFPHDVNDDFYNIQLALNLFEKDCLHRSLPHISAENIISKDAITIHNLLEIFQRYLVLFPSVNKSAFSSHHSNEPNQRVEYQTTVYHMCPNVAKIDSCKEVEEEKILHRCSKEKETKLPKIVTLPSSSASPTLSYSTSDQDEIIEQSLSPSESELPLQLKFNAVSSDGNSQKQVRFHDSHHTRKIGTRKWKEYFVRAAKTYGLKVPQHPKYRKEDEKKLKTEIRHECNLVDYLKDELPGINIQNIEEDIRNDYRRRGRVNREIISDTKKQDPVYDYLKSGAEKHELLRNHFQKQIEARERKLKIDEKKQKYQRIKNEITEEKILKCHLKRFCNELENRSKSRTLAIRNRDEILFRNVYKEGVKAESENISRIIKQRKEKLDKENEREMNKTISRINKFKTLLEIKDASAIQDLHFRQIDEERIKRDLWKAKYIL